jgi:hypothetical protein
MTERKKRPRPKKQRTARTAGGKKGSPEVLAEAAIGAQEGFRERTEAGHRAAGRVPPSEKTPARSAGATKVIDQSIRSYTVAVTEDEKLLQAVSDRTDFTQTDTWRHAHHGKVHQGFDDLAPWKKGVAIFGSARTQDPQYGAAQSRSPAGGGRVRDHHGRGSWDHGAANKGAQEGGGRSIGCNIKLPFEQGANPYVDTLVNSAIFRAEDDVHQYSNAFIIFPGGWHADEAFEALTLIKRKIYQFP